jgi:hypothetical protein
MLYLELGYYEENIGQRYNTANITAACIRRQIGPLVDPLRKTIIHLSYSVIGLFWQECINLPLPCGGLNISSSRCNHRPRFVVGSINIFCDMWEWTAERREHTKLLTHKTSVTIARTFLTYLDGNNAPANTQRQIRPDMHVPNRTLRCRQALTMIRSGNDGQTEHKWGRALKIKRSTLAVNVTTVRFGTCWIKSLSVWTRNPIRKYQAISTDCSHNQKFVVLRKGHSMLAPDDYDKLYTNIFLRAAFLWVLLFCVGVGGWLNQTSLIL